MMTNSHEIRRLLICREIVDERDEYNVFTYTTNISGFKKILEMRPCDLSCDHIMFTILIETSSKPLQKTPVQLVFVPFNREFDIPNKDVYSFDFLGTVPKINGMVYSVFQTYKLGNLQ